jgi:integrase
MPRSDLTVTLCPSNRRPFTRFAARTSGLASGLALAASPTGMPLRHGNFRRRVWLAALESAGLPAIHFHDLRHTGNHLSAAAGATLRELMERMGHSTTRAALIYLHATDERQRAVADAVDAMARTALGKAKKGRNSAASARIWPDGAKEHSR